MTHHLFRFQYLMDQHQTRNDLANRIFLSCANNPSVARTYCCQTEKIIILSEDDASFSFRPSQMFFVRRSPRSRFWNSQYIHTPST